MAGALIDILAVGVIDSSGLPLDSGRAYIYNSGTTTPITVYADIELTDPMSNPVTLSSSGKAEVYIGQSVRVVILDANGATVDDFEIQNEFPTVGEEDIPNDLTPSADNTNVVGSTAKRWREGHFVNLYAENFEVEALSSAIAGMVSNLGISLSGGILSIVDAEGGVLSSDNPGYVCVKSSTPGLNSVLKVTSGNSFNDDSNVSSDLNNQGWGITESSDWAEDVPFFLYVANRSNSDINGADGSSVFFIARNPVLSTTPASANNIHDTAGLSGAADTQNDILIMDAVTRANYVNLPCQLVGAVRMRWSTSTDDWTVQTLGNTDGLGPEALRATFAKTWTMPETQNGATSAYFSSTSGTIPLFTTKRFNYSLSMNGRVDAQAEVDGDAGTDGSGAAALRMHLPYNNDRPVGNISVTGIPVGIAFVVAPGIDAFNAVFAYLFFNASYVTFTGIADDPSGTFNSNITVLLNQFTNGNRRIMTTISYYPFLQ